MPPMSPSSRAARGVVPAHRPWHWLYQYCRKANIGSTLTCLGPSWEHAEGCGAAAGLISTFLVPAGLPVGLSPSPTAQQLLHRGRGSALREMLRHRRMNGRDWEQPGLPMEGAPSPWPGGCSAVACQL